MGKRKESFLMGLYLMLFLAQAISVFIGLWPIVMWTAFVGILVAIYVVARMMLEGRFPGVDATSNAQESFEPTIGFHAKL